MAAKKYGNKFVVFCFGQYSYSENIAHRINSRVLFLRSLHRKKGGSEHFHWMISNNSKIVWDQIMKML